MPKVTNIPKNPTNAAIPLEDPINDMVNPPNAAEITAHAKNVMASKAKGRHWVTALRASSNELDWLRLFRKSADAFCGVELFDAVMKGTF
jgi:thiamine biosynthesis protein ThiC